MASSFGIQNDSTRRVFEFKGEFYHFEAYRDGQLLEPIRPGRRLAEGARYGPLAKFVDEAYAGMYIYAPEDFMTGNAFRFAVYNAERPGTAHHEKVFKADSKLIQQIRSDFTEVLGEAEY